MDLTGIAAVLGVVAGLVATTWTIVTERSRLRALERLVALSKELPDSAEAAGSLRELADRMSADLLERYKAPTYAARAITGLAVLLISTLLLIFVVLDPTSPAYEMTREVRFLVLLLSLVTFCIGYPLAASALLLRVRVRRRIALDARRKAQEAKLRAEEAKLKAQEAKLAEEQRQDQRGLSRFFSRRPR